MSSDVCKHCTEAACLDVCPTGALMRTEFGTVVVQDDVCNGCGYCVSACPFGVIDRRESDGGAHKCTLCYDRIGDGLTPACAKACPTESIQFGPLDELRERAQQRVADLHDAGRPEARLYGADPDDGVGGAGAFFLLLDQPEVYGLPPDPVVTTRDLPRMWRHAGLAAAGLAAAVAGRVPGRAGVSAPPERGRRRAAAGAGGRDQLLLRPAGGEGVGVGPGHPHLPVPRRARGSVIGARRRRPALRSPGAGPRGEGRRGRRDQPVAGRAGARPRPPGPVRQHAARAQGDVADERRHLDRVRLRPARRWPPAWSHGGCRTPAPRPRSRPARSAPRSRPTPRC